MRGSQDRINPSPVRLVQIDVDGEPSDVQIDAQPGHRLWIEVHKAGQLVGVVERAVEGAGISQATFEKLAQEYSDVETPDLSDLPDEQLPVASVVVSTIYKRVELLQRTVQSLLALDYPEFEIIVVDNRVGRGHAPIPPFGENGRVKIVCEGTPGVSAARNRGFAEARGEFVAFTDDDVQVDRQWLKALGRAFRSDPSIDAIGGMVRPAGLETHAQLWFEEFYGGFTKSVQSKEWSMELVGATDPLFPYSAGHFGAGCNMAIRRSAYERVGGFDIRLGVGTLATSGEDLKLFMDIVLTGGKMAYVPSALVRHSHRRSEREFLEQVFAYGVGLTALFTDLIVEDPRHLIEIAKRVPRGLRMMIMPATPLSPSVATSYPRRTQWIEFLGMAYGPIAFFRSWSRVRRFAHRGATARD